jgi:signal recognition particle subunit SRP72
LQGIVALHQRQKNPSKAAACIREAIEYWSGQENADEDTFATVLRIAAKLALQLKDDAFAAEVYENYLEKVDGHDVEALCGLVQSLAVSDVARAEQYAMRLRVPAYDHLDAEELEQAAIPNISQQLKRKMEEEKKNKAAAAEAEADGEAAEGEEGADADKAEAQAKEKTKKKHKIRYPKGFDPENPGPPPDPERWLPKRERTEFKKRMSRKNKNLLRGPQGSMPTDDNAFRKQGPSTAQVEVSTDAGKRGPARGAQRPKKGKK